MSTHPDPQFRDDAGTDAARPARATESAAKMLLAGAIALAVVIVAIVLLA